MLYNRQHLLTRKKLTAPAQEKMTAIFFLRLGPAFSLLGLPSQEFLVPELCAHPGFLARLLATPCLEMTPAPLLVAESESPVVSSLDGPRQRQHSKVRYAPLGPVRSVEGNIVGSSRRVGPLGAVLFDNHSVHVCLKCVKYKAGEMWMTTKPERLTFCSEKSLTAK